MSIVLIPVGLKSIQRDRWRFQFYWPTVEFRSNHHLLIKADWVFRVCWAHPAEQQYNAVGFQVFGFGAAIEYHIPKPKESKP